jgi:hypothetical protein
MPRYQVVISQNGTTEVRIVTTDGVDVPTSDERFRVTEPFLNLDPDVIYSATVTRLKDEDDSPLGSVAARTQLVGPKKFVVDFVSPENGRASVGWIDQRGGSHYRVDTHLDDAGNLGTFQGSSYQSYSSDQTNGGLTITGLTNGTAYRFQVIRQSSAGVGGSAERTTSNSKATTPLDDGFPATDGYTGRGPAVVDGDYKAQMVTQDSTGQTGVLVDTRKQEFTRIRIRYYQGPASSTADEVTTAQERTAGSPRYFFPLTFDVFQDPERTLLGVIVEAERQQGGTVTLQVSLSPTYV